MDAIQAELQPGELVLAYLDDNYLVTAPGRARAAYDTAARVLRVACGIEINQGKLVSWNRSNQPAPPGIAELDTPGHVVWRADLPAGQNGVRVVGTPIGSDEFVRVCATEAAAGSADLLDRIPQLPASQDAWLLLLFCAVPRINHILRTTPPTQAAALAAAHDERISTAFDQLLGLPPDCDTQTDHGVGRRVWLRQARLPLRLGGCGLRDSARTSPAAYWASVADCLPVLHGRYPQAAAAMVDALETLEVAQAVPSSALGGAVAAGRALDTRGFEGRPTWRALAAGARPPPQEGANVDEFPALDEFPHGWQFYASRALEQTEHDSLLRSLAGTSPRGPLPGRARLRSCSGPQAASWMVAFPTSPTTRLSNEEFTFALRRRLSLGFGFLRNRARRIFQW